MSIRDAWLYPWDLALETLDATRVTASGGDSADDDDDDVPRLPNGKPWPPGMLKLRRMVGG